MRTWCVREKIIANVSSGAAKKSPAKKGDTFESYIGNMQRWYSDGHSTIIYSHGSGHAQQQQQQSQQQ